jgi:hypothetical protein
MRRVILNKIAKRTFYGSLFILASYLVTLLGVQAALLKVRFGVVFLDFFYVLFVSFFPVILQWIGYGILFSVAFLLLRYLVFPVHRLERHYLGIKGGNLKKSLFIIALLVFFLFLVPYLMPESPPMGYTLESADQGIIQAGSQLAAMEGYAGLVLGNLAFAMAGTFDFLVIKPLYLFYPVRSDAFFCSLLLSSLFFHSMMVGLSKKYVSVSRHVSKHLCQEGDRITLDTSMRLPFPSPTVSLKSSRIVPGKRKKSKIKSKRNIPYSSAEVREELTLDEGYYNFDIVPVSIFTLPFFHTMVYKVCDENSDLSVVPALKYKTRMFIRRPSVTKETGSLIRRQLGSSLDFADLRNYTHEDPLSRIWWKGLAKHGELLVKEFHSFAEDRWMLVLDFTNQNLSEDGVKNMLRFSKIFIELCTRKDIAVGLSAFSHSFHYIDYGTNKRDLMSDLTKVTMPLYEISPRGLELVLHDALGPDLERLKRKCRGRHMTLSTVYSYSGLGKQKTFLSWKGESVFRNCMHRFFTNLKRSGKIVMVTDGSPKNLEMFRKFKAMCENRRCPYLLVLTETQKDMTSQLSKAKVKHIVVPHEKLVKPNFVMGLVSLV